MRYKHLPAVIVTALSVCSFAILMMVVSVVYGS